MRFEDKVAIVTGGASGIGRASALRFARDGAKVAVADIDTQGGNQTITQIRDLGGEAVFVECDVARSDDVKRLVSTVVDRYGGVDILFANAAHLQDFHAAAETPDDAWQRSIGVTLTGSFLSSKYVIPSMLRRGGGSIIATASVGGLVAFDANAAYCAAKGGVVMLMKSIARDYGRVGIRANAIAPGAVNTPVMQADKRRNPDGWERALREMSLLERLWAEPDEIAAAAAYLASDEAAFITGSVLTVDGGWTAH